MKRTLFKFVIPIIFAAHVTTASMGQLIYQESFETDGDGTRYSLLDPGFEFTGDSGPGIWGRNSDAECH